MPEHEQAKPLNKHIMHLSFENQTYSDFQKEMRAKNIARYLFEDPKVGEHSDMGTIELLNLEITGVKSLKPKEELTGDEYLLRLLTLKHFESIE